MQKKNKILIVGKRPLPIGGVTIHVDRLLSWLSYHNVDYAFYDLKEFSIFSFVHKVFCSKYTHIHSSSPVFRLLSTGICKVLGSRSIVTFHGNIGRYNMLKNWLDYTSIYLCDYPVVLNNRSKTIADKYNKHSQLVSAFIPELNTEDDLPDDYKNKIAVLKNKVQIILCTNAFNWSLDKDGNEVYNITKLVEFFNKHKNWGLIISDPSGNCKKNIQMKFGVVAENILFIDFPHNFINIIKQTDGLLRYTTTDGDSLSIHEALDLNIPVIATDVVSRPASTIVVAINDMEQLETSISNIKSMHPFNTSTRTNNVPEIIQFYNKTII